MEELVFTEVVNRVSKIEAKGGFTLDLSDITAYALNRLPPLYATTEEGANYQRLRAQEELMSLILQKVDEAIGRYLDKPEFFPERDAISKTTGKEVLYQVSDLLQTYASTFPIPAQPLVHN
jgi:hypothetical protein